MTSPVDIANQALVKLSVPKIVKFTDKKKAADVMLTNYANSRDTLLRSYPFKFAKKRIVLAPLTSTPPWGFKHEYELPSDSVRLVYVDGHCVASDNSGMPDGYKLEGRTIRTNQGSQLKIIYISNEVPEAHFDPDFVRLLALQLALDGFTSLAGRGVGRRKLEGEFINAVDQAMFNGAMEEPNSEAYSNEWEDSRE